MFNNRKTPRKPQKRSAILLLCAALCSTVSVATLHAQASSTLPGTSTTRMTIAIANIDEKAPPVIVQRVETGDISQMLQTSGDVLPYLGADIHPKIAGEIVAINVSEGSQVKQGDILAEIDHRILDAQLEQAKAAVSVARSNVDAQNVQLKSAESALISARAQVAAVKAQATNLAATRKRFSDLFKEGAVSEQQLDDIVAQHDAIQAQLIAAESTVRQAEDGIQSGQVNLKMRNAQLLQAQSNLNAAEVQRENAFVKAPFTGIITARNFDPGAMANQGQRIFRLEQMNPVKIVGSLVEKDLMSLKAGETAASVRIDLVDRQFKGLVDKVYPAITAKTRTGQFEIVLENPENILRSGMYATINLALRTEKNVTRILKDALLSHAGGMFAIRVGSDGTAERVAVKVGIIQGSIAQVLEGLQPGDLVVSQAPELVKTGSKVKPMIAEEKR